MKTVVIGSGWEAQRPLPSWRNRATESLCWNRTLSWAGVVRRWKRTVSGTISASTCSAEATRAPTAQSIAYWAETSAWITRDPPCRVMGRIEFDFRLDIRPLLRQSDVARKLGVRAKNYIGAFRLMRSLLSGRGVEANDKVSLQDYVSRFTDDDMVHLFINCLSQLYFALSYRQASAGEFIWCFSRMFNDASFGYPQGGSGGSLAPSYSHWRSTEVQCASGRVQRASASITEE